MIKIKSENCEHNGEECTIASGQEEIVAKCEYDSESELCKETLFCSKIEPASNGDCDKGAISDKNENKRCVFENDACIEKTLCEIKTEPSTENCREVTPSDSTKICTFNSGTSKCEEKYLCGSSLTEEQCNSAITLSPETTGCHYSTKCEIKELCDLKDSPAEETDCTSIQTSDQNSKCVFDNESNPKKCIIKKVCNENLSKQECESAITLNPEITNCVYNSNSRKCEIREKCEEENAPSFEKCKAIEVSDSVNQKCAYDSTQQKCKVKTKCLKVTEPSLTSCSSAAPTDEENQKCLFGNAQSNCLEKTLCHKVSSPSENACTDAITENESKTKCFFEARDNEIADSIDRCIVKEICEHVSSPTKENCEKATTLDDSKKKCVLLNGSTKCKVKELCLKVDSPSKESCENALPSEESLKCVYEEFNVCKEKELCTSVKDNFETNCPLATTLDPKTKCVYESGNSCSVVQKKCSEITFGASEEICEDAPTDEESEGCKYDESSQKCIKKTKCLNFENPSNEQDCTSAPTSDYVTKKCILKTEEGKKSCKEENKICTEIKYGATEAICKSAAVSNDKKKCVLNNSRKGCTESNIEEEKASGSLISLSLVGFGLLFIFL